MHDSKAGREVRVSFQTLAEHTDVFSDTDADVLHRRINAAVDELKALGWPVERIIVRIKELAWEVGLRLGYSAHDANRHPAVAQAVLWCVLRYYEKSAAESE